jgi:HPt (histidine-containing phosphotransfer) domain-containing protein
MLQNTWIFESPQIQLKLLAEEMQAINKGLEKVEQELAASENDGAISLGFRKVRNFFLSVQMTCP